MEIKTANGEAYIPPTEKENIQQILYMLVEHIQEMEVNCAPGWVDEMNNLIREI